MPYHIKKFRGYRRELKRVLRVVEEYQPNWCPAEEDFREEWLDLGANRFFHPRGKDRKALMAALLRKTEELIAVRPADLPSCKIFLFVPGGDPALAEIILIYDPDRFQTFWVRTDPADQLWIPQEGPSLLAELGLESSLPERCVLEEFHWAGYVEQQLILGFGELP